MKKIAYFFLLATMVIAVAALTPLIKPEYNFPLDGGINKLFAAVVALAVTLWVSLMEKRSHAAVIIAIITAILMMSCGAEAGIVFGILCAVCRVLAEDDYELRRMFGKEEADVLEK